MVIFMLEFILIFVVFFSVDLQLEDSGLYTCSATSDSGESSWSASLSVVEGPSDSLHRSPEPSTYPHAPSKPRILNSTESSISLSWNSDEEENLVGYTVEYWSPDLQTGWVVAAHRVPDPYMVVRELKPDSSYVFIVRAENAHGLSPASEVSAVAKTLSSSRSVPRSELDAAREMLSTKTVELLDARPLSSSSVKLLWSLSAPDFVEGLYIRFRELSGGSHNYNILTVLDTQSKSYSVTNLKKFTKYEFFVSPFYKSVEGQPSNSRVAQTLEDVPSAPPDNIAVGIFNDTAGWVKWSPPPPQHHNGIIIGYKLQIKGGITRSMTINSSTTSVLVSNLTTGNLYNARVAALTQAGLGPFSNPVSLLTTQRSQSRQPLDPVVPFVEQTWFVVLLAVLALSLLAVTGGFLYIKRKQTLNKQLGHLSVPVVNASQVNTKESLWIDRGWRAGDCDKDSSLPLSPQPADYAEVDTKSLSTFYNRKSPDTPTPYATTMLLPPPPSWTELIPPPPSHPPPECPRENPPVPPPRGGSNYGSVGGYACYAVHVPRIPQHPKLGSCNNFDNHCSLASGSSGRRSNHKGHCHVPHSHNCDNKVWANHYRWDERDADVDTDVNSCTSSHDTTCSCSGSSCVYAEAGPSTTSKMLAQCQIQQFAN